METWKPIPEYNGIYEASDQGRIMRVAGGRGTAIGKILKPRKNIDGYQLVNLCKSGESRQHYVHRLVLAAFVGLAPPTPRMEANHIDGKKANNKLNNLEYTTGRENMLHSYRIGLHKSGEGHGMSKVSEGDVRSMRQLRKNGALFKEIAKQFGIAASNARLICRRETWKHV